ncbi:hypothetical protein AK812_SmicGene41416 [Symbiodinium microadriaticum]|uniref:Reverse transcriptase domain-containing protein n=1 Tax=Symbiodinium microadriaticum TaxID=2951 RepID=A0A1Q9C660_SYMMI|nr:hypothetical protein AK812_SmicGene41416 [Symbiodinium microadriaticum]
MFSISSQCKEPEHGYLACQVDTKEEVPGDPANLLLYADDLEAMGKGPRGRRGIPLSYLFLAALGYPFKWAKTRGLFPKRATWLVEWLRLLARTGKTEAKAFAQGLGVLCGWLADRLESGGRLQKPEPLLESAAPLSFFTDAKAEAGRAWIGGFLELVDGCEGPWFSLEVLESWAPWAFAKGDPGKVIAVLELLATLVGVRLWVPDGDAKKTSRVAIRGYTDNRSNESLLRKAMTTKFPSTLVLMELAEELSAKNCELQLQWIRRDLNQLADDLTNENFASFDPNFRIDLKGEALEWRVLGRLLRCTTSYFEELGEAKRTKKVHATRISASSELELMGITWGRRAGWRRFDFANRSADLRIGNSCDIKMPWERGLQSQDHPTSWLEIAPVFASPRLKAKPGFRQAKENLATALSTGGLRLVYLLSFLDEEAVSFPGPRHRGCTLQSNAPHQLMARVVKNFGPSLSVLAKTFSSGELSEGNRGIAV